MDMDISTSEQNSAIHEVVSCAVPLDGFSCVISMHDGVVMYTTSSLTTNLGYPKDMWIGRSFIDFVHPRDRNTFASQITKGLAVPKVVNEKTPGSSVSTMVCRIRRYRGLSAGFGVKDRIITYVPFLLKLTFKNISDEEGKIIYLVIHAKSFFSAFKIPNETVTKEVPFIMRHAANGIIEYIDPESVPYLGYLPQDLTEKNALQLYHPDDLPYLRHVYEIIVKEGGMPRCKAYRMRSQNGDYIKLETEWSSFINPWSKKLEFVIGKHYIIQGPENPDVFKAARTIVNQKVTEEENKKVQILQDSIIRIMNEVLTKPAEVAKQLMSKRCQNLATFMESLMEDPPKVDDELRLEIQDPDNSYYERDSVMLGGISPHHDFHDSISSTETPLSYTQLNYNDNLQRYFNCYEEYTAAENILGLNYQTSVMKYNQSVGTGPCLSPLAQTSGDSGEFTSSCESSGAAGGNSSFKAPLGDLHPIRLTESLLTKHNVEMEKELMKIHRETRSNSKGEREKTSSETRHKKMEHLARCNATYQPTRVGVMPIDKQPHGVKRSSNQTDEGGAHKHHCPSPRLSYRRQRTLATSSTTVLPSSTITTTVAASHWPTNTGGNMNTFILGVGMPQQMSIVNPVAAMTSMMPMYYNSAATQPIPSSSGNPAALNTNPNHYAQTNLACTTYGQPVYNSPFMYSPMNMQSSYPVQQTLMAQTMQFSQMMNPLRLANRNYEEVAKAPYHTLAIDANKMNRFSNSEEIVDKTDEESSYSSFYSSFFKTESGSTEDSSDAKKGQNSKDRHETITVDASNTYVRPQQIKKIANKGNDPLWMEQVCMTSELTYKYQVVTKPLEEVLSSDKQKMTKMEQPSLVNEQLNQLYLDLQLEGVAARLTLEEGITSSSSSGEETTNKSSKSSYRRRAYSKLVMIYEEDTPLPSPPEDKSVTEPSS